MALARPAALAGIFGNPRGTLAVELTEGALASHYGVGLTELEAAVKQWLSVPHR